MAQTQNAKLSRRYWLKQVILAVLAGGFGIWGFVDGFIIYPSQAVKFAEWSEWEYLEFLRNPPAGASPGANLGVASVADPVEAYADLGEPSNNRSPEDLDDYRGNWLDALSIAGRLDAQYTTFPRDNAKEGVIGSAFERHESLRETWGEVNRDNAPKRRSRFDIMMQYPIFVVGAGAALFLLYRLFRAASTKYSWDPDAKRLSLPGGIQVTPDQIEEFDKSLWHKFYVALVLAESHPTHAGQALKVDLYRHIGPEDCILEMERERFPEEAELAEESEDSNEQPDDDSSADDNGEAPPEDSTDSTQG